MNDARRHILASALAAFVVAVFATSTVPAGAAAPPALHPTGAVPPRHFVAVKQVHFGTGALTAPPASFSLKSHAVPIGNQGDVGSCVAWAVDYGMLGWYANQAAMAGPPFQPMYVYSQINVGRAQNHDWGSYPLDAFSVLQSQGSDTQAHYSHDNFDWQDLPNQSEIDNAAQYKIAGYHTLFSGANQPGNVNAIKTTIAASHPVAIEIPVRYGFDHMGSSATSVDTDYTSDTIRGYHEILAIGYDAVGLVIQNSWGTGWGAAGFGKLSWGVVQHDVLEADYADGLAPHMVSVTAAPIATGAIGATTVPLKVSWTSDGVVASYSLSYSQDGGADVPVSMPNVRATSYTFIATPGSTYTFKVHAIDSLARPSDDLESAPITPSLLQQDDGSISYQGVWTMPPVVAASGGSLALTTKANATATFSTTARTMSWVAYKGPTLGQAKIYVDNVLKTTVNLYATYAGAKVIAYAIDFGSAGAHTLKIVAVGTVGHPGVAVDAFVVTT
jgi:hypothetical protein